MTVLDTGLLVTVPARAMMHVVGCDYQLSNGIVTASKIVRNGTSRLFVEVSNANDYAIHIDTGDVIAEMYLVPVCAFDLTEVINVIVDS